MSKLEEAHKRWEQSGGNNAAKETAISQEKSTSGSKLREVHQRWKWSQLSDADKNSYVNSLNEQYSALASRAGSYAGEVAKRQESRADNGYIAGSGDWLEKVNAENADYSKAAREYARLLSEYEAVLDKDFVSGSRSMLHEAQGLYKWARQAAISDTYYGQWDTAEDYNKYYIGWLYTDAETNEKMAAARQAQYQSNADRIAELDGLILEEERSHDWFSGKSEKQKAYEEEKERLEAENRQYTRTQGVLDSYYAPETEEFLQNAAYRDYANASKEELWAYDISAMEGSNALSNGGSFDEEGNILDAKGNVVQSANAPVVEDKLGLFLSASEEDVANGLNELALTNGNYTNTWANLMQEGDFNSWKYLKENEINIYYDLYKREGQAAAYQYLDAMTTELNRRETQATTDYINSTSGWEQFGWNIASVPMSVFGGAFSFADDLSHIIQGEDINPYSKAHALQTASGDVRAKTAADIDEAGNVAIPWVDYSFGDLYQSLMSAADSAVGVAVGGGTYRALMGMGAASSEMQKLYEQGASVEQIAAGGILAGAAEIIFEKYSIDKLASMGDTKSIWQLIINALKQGGVEASEEVFTEIANTITNAIVMGSQSDWVDVETFAKNVVNAGLGGFFSGDAMGGVGATAGYVQYQRQAGQYGQSIINNGGVDALLQSAKDMFGDEGAPNAMSIGKLANKTETKPSARNVGLLADAMGDAVTQWNRSDIQTALEEKGLSGEDAGRVSEYLNKAAQGEYFTDAEAEEIESDERIAEVYRDMIGNSQSAVNTRTQQLAGAISGEEYSRIVRAAQGQEEAEKPARMEQVEPVADSGATVSKTESIGKDTNTTAKAAEESPTTGKKSAQIESSQEERTVSIEDASKKYGAQAVAMVRTYQAGQDVERYDSAYGRAYEMGYSGVSLDYMKKSPSTAYLTDIQKELAWEAGKAASDTKAAEKAAAIGKLANGKIGWKKGAVRGDGVTVQDLNTTLNKTQGKAYRILSTIAEATGIDIVLYRSELKDGKYQGAQGQYKHSEPGTLYIDLNAGILREMNADELAKYTMLRTFSHEFPHFIENWNPVQYNEFRRVVFDTLDQRGENVEKLIAGKQKNGMSYDAASREVVAEAMTDILPDSHFVETLANEHKTIFQKLLDKLKEFLADIKDYFTSIEPNNSREANALKETVDGTVRYVENIVKMYDRVAVQAVENYQKTVATDEVIAESATTTSKEAQTEIKTEVKTEVKEEVKPEPEVKTSEPYVSENGYTITDNPQYGSIEVRFAEKPSAAVLDVLKANKFRWNGKKKVWYGKATHEAISGALDNAYASEGMEDFLSTDPAAIRAELERRAETGESAVDGMLEQAVQTYEADRAQVESAEETAQEVATPEQNDAYTSLSEKLRKFNRVDTERFVFRLFNKDGKWHGKIDAAEMDVGSGIMVSNARGVHYTSEVFDTRQEAMEDILAVARNNKLLDESPVDIKEETQNGENADNQRAVLEPEPDGEGTARLLDEVQAEDVQGTGGQRGTASSDSDGGREAGRNGDRTDTADRSGGSEGSSQSGDLRRDALSQEEKQAKAKKLQKTVSRQVEQKSTEAPKGKNFVIGESLNLPSGEKARFKANVDAIRLIKQLETDGRYATAAEQEVLSKYVGWGGLSNAFGEMQYNRETRKREMVAKPGWEKEFAEFRQLVTDGIITEEEYSAMSASTKNAHYTSMEVIKAMYDGLAQLGFTGGRMLEPSSGVGNFVGGMPVNMSQNVKSWTMVELDRITGQIAKYLYPNADVRIQGFETANIPDNYMDVAIGNVPFGNYGVVDRNYPKRITKAIHNYFFAKTLDKVRPGGLVMFITSSFTMNGQDTSIRQYIMDRADLLGAIRLPNTAFSGNAGTEVVTDILVLKKRAPGTEYGGEAFLEAPYRNIGGNWQGANVNEYFDNHPEMVLGTAELSRGMYGANSLTYSPLTDKGSLGDQIREAFKNITGKMDYKTQTSPEKANFAVERAGKKTKMGGLEVKGGKVFRNENGTLTEVSSNKATVERVTGLLGIRDAYRTLANYLQQGQDAKFIKAARNELNKAYDDFVKKYGLINSPKNKAAIAGDPDKYSILSLENYDAKKKTATKADIFTKDTISPNKTVTHVDDIASGVIVSINRTGGIDTGLIAKITGKTQESVTRELIDSRMAFKTKDGSLETPETYLSGNVRAKLREAEALAPMDKDFQNNVEELRRVIPKDIPFNDIFVAVGTPWIPNNVYADFIAETLGGYNNENSYRGPDVTVGRTNSGEFKIVVNNKVLSGRYQNTQKWGTKRRTFLDLMTALMSNGSLTVNDYIEDGNGRKKAVVNKVETAAAQAKAEEISKEFQEWLWKDETRRTELASLYNETFNALVPPKYSGRNLTVNGLNAEFNLRGHQADAVQRIISSGGNSLIAHKVGAGKTLEMAAAAMKLRELGIVKKPMFVVPKSLVAQWGVEFKNYFPASRLLVADEKSFSKENRKVFSNWIANNDYDAIILSYEQFEKIPLSNAYLHDFYQQQIDEILDAIAEEKAEHGKGITVKEMEKKKAQLEKKQAELTKKPKDEDNIDFDLLGIDSLFVDEAHNFKNLQYVTRMSNISGLGNTNGSQRAFDLYTKVRYLQGLNGGRGIVFATATPVMNSMAELYIMQKYLQSDMLEQLGLKTFDAWAKQFGEVVNSVEIKPSGQGFRVKQTFSNFRNLNELQLLFRSFSDVLTDVPGLKIPKMKGGKVNTVVCEPGQFQKDYMAELEKRADNVKNVDPSVDNMLKITSDGRKVSYTQRMIDPTLPYEPGCKIYRCCENVLKEYQESNSIKGTQIIFCDMATPKGRSSTATDTDISDDTDLDTSSAQLYDDMKAYLVKKGIPAKEIAFIHDADTDAKKKQLFADVNDGKVRVLIGSTGKMGVGMNAQKRIVAIHHLDAPWRPGDVEQRDGRAFRQKNMNEEVSKYTYVTEGSFDARLWDILDRKQHFIEQIMNGEDIGRSAEDTGDVTLSAAEVKALASGNPMIMEQVQLSNDLTKLNDLKKAHNSSIVAAKAKLLSDEQRIATLEKSIANCKTDIKARVDTYSDGKFSMRVGNQTFTEKKDAGVALSTAIVAKAKQGEFVTVGKFAGFDLRVMKQGAEYIGHITGKQGYRFNVYTENTTYMVNHIISIVEGLENRLQGWETSLSEAIADRDAQEKMIAEPFAKQAELDQKLARYNEVMAILNPKEEQVIGDNDGVQEQSRDYLEDNEPDNAREWSVFNRSLANQTTDIKPGETKHIAINTADHIFLVDATGYMEYDAVKKFSLNDNIDYVSKIRREFINGEKEHSGRSDRVDEGIGPVIGRDNGSYAIAGQRSETEGNAGMDSRELETDTPAGLKESYGYGSWDELIDAVKSGAMVMDDEGNIIQFQERSEVLTDRDILEMAAENVQLQAADMTEGERDALRIFQDRLGNLRYLQQQRKEQGRLYKEQQFGPNVDRKAAEQTHERMKILDTQIQRASDAVLDVQEKPVLRRVLQNARTIVEKAQQEKDDQKFQRWRDRRDNAAAIKKYRERIRTDVNDLTGWILKPDNKSVVNHVPEALKNAVVPFLSSIDFMSKRQLGGGDATVADRAFLDQLNKLKKVMNSIGGFDLNDAYEGYADLPPDFMQNLDSFIQSAQELLNRSDGEFIINKMTAAELQSLSKVVRNLKQFPEG